MMILTGAVAQLGERLNGIQEVVGSIPSSSTMNLPKKPPHRTTVGGFFVPIPGFGVRLAIRPAPGLVDISP